MNQPIVLVKIGGSLITDKNKPYTVRKKALNIIGDEVKKASTMGKILIIGHGAGSFAHVPAKKYQTHQGIINNDSYRGIAEVADVAAQLNRIVVKILLEKGVNAVSVSPLSSMTASNHQLDQIFTKPIEQLLSHGLLPVVYGDQILDTEIGCTIFSTEKVLAYLGLSLKEKGYQVEQIIQCGQTNGVYDADGHTIQEINPQNFKDYKQALGGSGGVDVTGGMLHKVEETLALAEKGIPGLIIDGIVHGTLSDAIAGQEVMGTKIVAK
jgi:isopentenyl phosphate kinase